MTVESDRLQEYWDSDAATYVHTHEISSAATQAAWRAALTRLLPPPPARVLHAGAGTGAVSLLLAELGYQVTALDFSPKMLGHLKSAADQRGLDVTVVTAGAHEPPEGPFDAVTARLLVWMLPNPAATLAAWRRVAPSGRLAVFEGLWGSADPVQARRQQARVALSRLQRRPASHHHTDDPEIKQLFSHGARPDEICAAVSAGGWPAVRLERLRDVEWTQLIALPPAERLLGTVPWYAVAAG